MSLVDGEERPGLPSMSWDSVVGGAREDVPTPAPPAPPADAPEFSLSLDGSASADTAESGSDPATEPSPGPVTVSMPSLASPADELVKPSIDLSVPPLASSSTPPSVGATSPAGAAAAPPLTMPSLDVEPPASAASSIAPVSQEAVDPSPAPNSSPTPIPEVTVPTPQPSPQVVAPAPQPEPKVAAPTPRPAPQPEPNVIAPAPQPAPEVAAPAPHPAQEAPAPHAVAAPVSEVAPAASDAPAVSAAPSPSPSPSPAPSATVLETTSPAPAPAPVSVPDPAPAESAAAPAPALANVAAPVAPTPASSPLAVDVTDDRRSRRARKDRTGRVRKDRSRGLARFAAVVLVIAALGAAGVVFGRPYLLPDDWDAQALKYAESVEAVRGVDFVEPVTLTVQPTADHQTLVAQELLGDVQSQLPLWRSLGLAGPEGTDDASLAGLLEGVSPAIYSRDDGQVYVDEGYALGDRDARITQAMAVAALDQDLTFSIASADLDSDDRALVDAHVMQQAAEIQRASDEPFTVLDPNVAPFAFLPPVLDYRVTAPYVFRGLLPAPNEVEANPLADLAVGPGPLATEPMILLTRESQVDGDLPLGETVPMDRSFWYLVFASHLDATTAYDMSNSIEQSGLQTVSTSDGVTCAVATFSGGNSAVNAELTARLVRWSESTAIELGSTVTALPDSSVQLRSCDPAGSYTSAARNGGARELIGWRAADLALTIAILEQGGTAETVEAARPLLAQSEAVLAVTALPAGTPADEVAEAANAAALDIANAVLELSASAES